MWNSIILIFISIRPYLKDQALYPSMFTDSHWENLDKISFMWKLKPLAVVERKLDWELLPSSEVLVSFPSVMEWDHWNGSPPAWTVLWFLKPIQLASGRTWKQFLIPQGPTVDLLNFKSFSLSFEKIVFLNCQVSQILKLFFAIFRQQHVDYFSQFRLMLTTV